MGYQSNKAKSRPFFLLLIFALLWFGVPSTWKIVIRSGFEEFHAPLWDLSSRIEDLSHYWGHLSDSKETLIKKGKLFQRTSINHSLQLNNIRNLSEEEARLRKLQININELEERLQLDQQKTYKPIISRVSKRLLTSWWQSLGLRKGSLSSIQVGDGVIFHGGVIGRIHRVGLMTSEVQLITNPSFRIVAHFEGDERPVTFQGNGIQIGGFPSGLVLDVPQDLTASKQKPLQLITSSLGQTFPQGIPIGKVFELEGGEDGVFKTGNVILNKSLSSVREITILKAVNES